MKLPKKPPKEVWVVFVPGAHEYSTFPTHRQARLVADSLNKWDRAAATIEHYVLERK